MTNILFSAFGNFVRRTKFPLAPTPKSHVIKAEVRANQLELYRHFIKHFGLPERVYYPGCGHDATPAVAFRKSIVICLDPEKFGLELILRRAQTAKVICNTAERFFAKTSFDVVVDMHSYGGFQNKVRDLRSDGYLIIARKGSSAAFDSPQFDLVGVFLPNQAVEPAANDVEHSLIMEDLRRFEEMHEDPDPIDLYFGNGRKIYCPYYIFKKKD